MHKHKMKFVESVDENNVAYLMFDCVSCPHRQYVQRRWWTWVLIAANGRYS